MTPERRDNYPKSVTTRGKSVTSLSRFHVAFMHGKFAAAKVSTFVVSDFCVVWDFDCHRLCITPLCRCVICHSHHMTKQTSPSFDGRQAHWAALAFLIQSIAGDFLMVSDANDLPQLTSVKCIKTSPFGLWQPPRTRVVREYRDYESVVEPQA